MIYDVVINIRVQY